jgi:integrase
MNLNQLKARIATVRKSGNGNSIGVGDGAYLQVRGANLSWTFRFRFNDEPRVMGMGAYDTLSMTAARKKARGYRKQVNDDIDPLAARDDARGAAKAKAKASVTLAYAINRFLAPATKQDPDAGDALAGFSSTKHRRQWRATLESDALKELRKMPCSAIETTDIARALRPIWDKRKTARRLLGRIERVLNFARVNGWRKGSNPATYKEARELLPKDKPPTVGHAALAYERMPQFMARLRARSGNAARCLELIILTAGRRNEIHGMKWSEYDPVKKTLSVPASRMKRRRQHVVPLSQRAIDILKSLPNNGALVFEGEKEGRPFGASAMTTLLQSFHKVAKVVNEVTDETTLERITIHGFRSSFSGWAAESNQHFEAKEHALAHRKEGVAGIYEKVTHLARRTHIMQAWADFCEHGAADNVRQIREA